MKSYLVTFARIGRTQQVEPLRADVDGANHLAEAIHTYARPHLRSHDIEVHLDLDAMKGLIWCGGRNGGSFTIAEAGA